MTSTPSVCPTDIEQCLNRPLMTIAAYLLNITISSVSLELNGSNWGELRVLVLVLVLVLVHIELRD